jgi:phosphatidylglycerol---prolipoprotein diacylglyceryl transferase
LEFPVWIDLGPWRVHPHPLFESLGYFLGFRLYLHLRKGGDHVTDWHRLVVLAAAICGGTIGSKVLAWLEDPARTLGHISDIGLLFSGKSIVGGLVGGLITVELVKKWIGERARTGDLYALPLIAGMAIGRIGCFLTGLSDETHGLPTSLPWGMDFGDGIARHPAQLYELLFLAGLALFIIWRKRRPYLTGDLFMCFMAGYLGWRLLVDFIKPYPDLALGLGAIQWVCLATLIYYAPHIPRLLLPGRTPRSLEG